MTVFSVSCGTMPVPSMPQPESIATDVGQSSSSPEQTDNADTKTVVSATAAANNDLTDGDAQSQSNKPASVAAVNPELEESVETQTTTQSTSRTTSQTTARLATPTPASTSPQTESAEEDVLQGPVISNAQTALFTATLAQSDTQSENAREHGTGPKPGEIEIKSEASNSSAGETLQASHAPTAVVDSSKVTKEVPKFATVTADDRVNNAIAFLNSGEEQQAEQELADALVIEPGNRSARKLMRQLHESPDSFFEEEEYFEYRLRSNETLISVAEKFLKDPLDFYMLAKLNDIDYPNSITPGKVLMIPGQNDFSDEIPVAPLPDVPREDPSNISEPPAESVKTEADIKIERAKVYYAEHRFREAINLIQPYANQKPVARYAPLKELLAQCYLELADELGKKGNLLEAQATLESSLNILPDNKSLNAQLTVVKNQREAERLYHLALQESKSGKESQALNDLAKALQLNPDHTQAKKQMIDLRLTVVEEYHKQAMVLYRKQELSRAIEKWDDVLRLDPNHELAKKYRARALELQRKIEQL